MHFPAKQQLTSVEIWIESRGNEPECKMYRAGDDQNKVTQRNPLLKINSIAESTPGSGPAVKHALLDGKEEIVWRENVIEIQQYNFITTVSYRFIYE